jgi:hypothetical protein
MNKYFLTLILFLSVTLFCWQVINAAEGKSLPLVESSTTTIKSVEPINTAGKQIGNNILKPQVIAVSKDSVKPFAINVEGSKAMTKFVTPNNDHKNDTFVFRAYNPMDLAVRGKIYSLKNRLVASMQDAYIDDSDNYSNLEWNPNSGSERAQGGVYIYQIVMGEKVYKGTVIVIK